MRENNYDYASSLNYNPNIQFQPGLSLTLSGFTIAGSFTLAQSEDSPHALKGETEGEYYSLAYFKENHGIKFFYQDFTGLHIGNIMDIDDTWEEGNEYPYFPDMKRQSTSGTYYYTFDPKGFSIDGLMNQSTFYKPEFSYSLIATVGVGQHSVSGNGAPILDETQRAFYEESQNLETVTIQEINGTFGAGLSTGIWKLYFAGYAGVGPSFQSVELSNLDGTSEKKTDVNFAYNGIVAFGYSGETFFAGLYMLFENVTAESDELSFDFSQGTRESFIGWRF